MLSALEICDYEYFIIGKETDDEIKEQCGICSYHGSGELTEHIQAHFQLVSCKGKSTFKRRNNLIFIFFKYIIKYQPPYMKYTYFSLS